MSVVNLSGHSPIARDMLSGKPPRCFLCGKRVKNVAVIWAGSTTAQQDDSGLLVLHPPCANTLSLTLIRDAGAAERLMAGKSLEAGIDRTLLPVGEA